MKYVYYGFGAFIGFVCGIGLNLIFYWLDQSGGKFAGFLIQNFGFLGKYLLELINALPVIGAALGIILIKLLFNREVTDNHH
ncbi:MAG: hypothetical protein HN907_14480 [Nitrospina sp.]|nr:hypothetical protein [Nitrospina sp.]